MSRVPLGLISALLILTVSGCTGLAAGADPERPSEQAEEPAKPVAPTATPVPTAAPLAVDDLLGEDGRLSVLVLGSDRRDGIIGERTDAIIVASLDPGTGRVAMASLPRDTINVPIAPGKVYPDRINTLFWTYQRATGKDKQALKKTRKALEYAFDTEIDYYAMVDFAGLVRLINAIGGVDVTLEEPLIDPTMHLGKRGLRLKAGHRQLDGKKALAFSRSRHTDSDYERSRRQQQVLAAAARKVHERGSSVLPALVELADRKLVTDIPMEAAPLLFALAGEAKLTNPKSMVLAPSRWARPGAQQYTIAPRVVEVRKMFDRVFRPVGQGVAP